MSLRTTRMLLIPLLVPALFALCCGGKPLQMPPVNVLDLEKPLTVKVESVPSGAAVFETGNDGSPSAFLGATPLEIVLFELGKEEWKFNPESDFLADQEKLGDDTLGQLISVENDDISWDITQGKDEYCIDFTISLDGYRPARVIRCIHTEEIPQLWKRPFISLKAELVRSEEE